MQQAVALFIAFKLSRFGRNAADVLSSLQRLQDFGVNLICVEGRRQKAREGKWNGGSYLSITAGRVK